MMSGVEAVIGNCLSEVGKYSPLPNTGGARKAFILPKFGKNIFRANIMHILSTKE